LNQILFWYSGVFLPAIRFPWKVFGPLISLGNDLFDVMDSALELGNGVGESFRACFDLVQNVIMQIIACVSVTVMHFLNFSEVYM
jgi:hypothetical protein